MNRTVSRRTGWTKLPEPPVAQRANATTGIAPAVTTARSSIDIVRPRAPSQNEAQPHASANAATASADTRCTRVVPGSARAARPKIAVAVHMAPDTRSGREPSPYAWSRRGNGSEDLARERMSHYLFRVAQPQA